MSAKHLLAFKSDSAKTNTSSFGAESSSQNNHKSDFVDSHESSLRFINPERLLTLQQVQEWLTVSDSTMRRLVRNGALPIVRIGGCIRINPDDVRKYIKRQTERVHQ